MHLQRNHQPTRPLVSPYVQCCALHGGDDADGDIIFTAAGLPMIPGPLAAKVRALNKFRFMKSTGVSANVTINVKINVADIIVTSMLT